MCRWWAARKQLSELTGRNEARAYVLEIYTDDPLGAKYCGSRKDEALSDMLDSLYKQDAAEDGDRGEASARVFSKVDWCQVPQSRYHLCFKGQDDEGHSRSLAAGERGLEL